MGALMVTLLAFGAMVILSNIFIAPIWNIAIMLVLWALAGAVAGRLIRGKGYGFASNVALGLIGGVVGSLLLAVVGWTQIGEIFLVGPILVGVIGALIFVMAVRLFHNEDFGR